MLIIPDFCSCVNAESIFIGMFYYTRNISFDNHTAKNLGAATLMPNIPYLLPRTTPFAFPVRPAAKTPTTLKIQVVVLDLDTR